MSSVPVWVWMSSATFAGAGVYLWWRLVVQTTDPHTTARRIGTVALGLTAVGSGVR